MSDIVSKKKCHLKRKLLFFVFASLTVLWIMVIFGFSGQDGKNSSSQSRAITQKIVQVVDHDYKMPEKVEPESIDMLYDKIIRKIAHVCIYAILGFITFTTVFIALRTSKRKKCMCFLSIILCVLVAAADEFNQSLTEGRDGQVLDVLIDFFGIILGILLCNSVLKRIQKKKKCKSE